MIMQWELNAFGKKGSHELILTLTMLCKLDYEVACCLQF